MEPESLPALSVVVACLGVEGIDEVLKAYVEQSARVTEVIAVSESDLSALAKQFPTVRFLRSRGGTGLVPHLWAAGIDSARGRLVATTTSHFLPCADYVVSALASHERLASAGIGGRINPPAALRSVPWAVYLLRYSAYLGMTAREVTDFAGDNGVYRATALRPFSNLIREQGFWEHEIHKRLRGRGERLAFDPSIEMRQAASFSFVDFVQQRFRHGFLYGAERARRESTWRVLQACRGALAPGILVARVAQRVASSRKYVGPFLLSFVPLCCFAVAWGLGETIGCMAPSSSSEERPASASDA